jgi:hypothetical protein
VRFEVGTSAEVRVVAGAYNYDFGIEPHTLAKASGGAVTDLKRA